MRAGEKTVGAVILAGGTSFRMGADKAALRLGGKTFLERIAQSLAGFDERLLSVDEPGRYSGCGFTVVVDRSPGTGPAGGLYTALTDCRSDYLLAVGCDMPLFSSGLAAYMCAFVADRWDAFVAVTRDGRCQPLCAVYARSAAKVFGEELAAGRRSVFAALDKMRVREVPLCHTIYPDTMARGVNTVEEYRSLRREMDGPPIIAVSGVKNAGKTTLLERLLPLLAAQGLRVVVIKHDGHDFEPDVPGTDSHRLRAAGAYGAAVYSSARYMLAEEREGVTVPELAAYFPEADLILLEGGKHSYYPKIEVIRAAISTKMVCDPDTLLAVCTDTGIVPPGVPALPLDDYTGVCSRIQEYLQTRF